MTGGTAPFEYHWEMIDCDGFITGGQGTSTIEYTVGYTTQNFLLTVIDANGCEAQCTISIGCSKDREDNSQNFTVGGDTWGGTLAVYPNPATDRINVVLSDEMIEEGFTAVWISNLYGQLFDSRNGIIRHCAAERTGYQSAPIRQLSATCQTCEWTDFD